MVVILTPVRELAMSEDIFALPQMGDAVDI